MEFSVELRRPWVKYSVVAIVALGLIYIIYKNVSGGTTVISAADPNSSQLAMQNNAIAAQQAQTQAQLASQAQNIQGTINLARITTDAQTTQQNSALATQLAIAQLTTAEQSHQNDVNVSGQLQLAAIQSDNVKTQITAQKQIALAETNAAIQSNLIQSQTNLGIAQINASTQQLISTNALEGQKSNNQMAEHIAGINASTQQNASDDSMWGTLAIAALAFL